MNDQQDLLVRGLIAIGQNGISFITLEIHNLFSDVNCLISGNFRLFDTFIFLHLLSVCVCVCVCFYVCFYVCMNVCKYLCAHVCMYVCVHVCMHVFGTNLVISSDIFPEDH